LNDTPFEIYKNFQCLPSKNCQLHGEIDFLLYNNSNKFGWPLVGVNVVKQNQTILGDIVLDVNSAEPFLIGKWLRTLGRVYLEKDEDFKKMIEGRHDWDHCRVIQTNGHYWRLFEFSISEFKMRHTKWYQPRTINDLIKEGQNNKVRLRDSNNLQKRIWND